MAHRIPVQRFYRWLQRLKLRMHVTWRFMATGDSLSYRDKKVQGLALPESILPKLYHDNAVRLFPGWIALMDAALPVTGKYFYFA
jgi:hypothetical protein